MESLDFNRYAPAASVEVVGVGTATLYVVLALIIFAATIAISAVVTLRLRVVEPRRSWALSDLPPAARMLALLGLVCLMLVQAVAVAGVYVQTRVVHESTADYFAHLSVARLVGTSHAHLFGYAFLYGAIGFIATLGLGSPRLKAIIVALLMWSGPFDVASWWGIKLVHARFEWLSVATAIASSVASLAALLITARGVRASRP